MIDDTFTPERISQDRALCDAATPGEWIVNQIKGHTENQIETKHPDFANRKPWGHIVAEVGLCAGDLTQTKFESDSAFIAAARSRWPAALDAIENERMFNSDQEAQLRARDQRREHLLRECLAYVEPTGPSPSCQSLAAKIRDELEGGADATLS